MMRAVSSEVDYVTTWHTPGPTLTLMLIIVRETFP